MQKRLLLSFALTALLLPALVWAQTPESPTPQSPRTLPSPSIPAPLLPWVPWVLANELTYGCTNNKDASICVWAGTLKLDLGRTGGRFEQLVSADRPVDVQLPGGNDGPWPLGVTIDGAPGVVKRDGESPVVRLAAGSHRIAGAFRWTSAPEMLAVPTDIARVELTVNEKVITHPRIDASNHTVWLEAAAEQVIEEQERLELEVMRQVRDDVPMTSTTLIALRVSGRAREINLGAVALPGFEAIKIDADLPVRIEPDGSLLAQARGGNFVIKIESHSIEAIPALTLAQRPEPWPHHEIWTFVANTSLRQTSIGGVGGIDPARTNLPTDWRGAPAYVVNQGDTMRIDTLRRGEPEPPPSSLTLQREYWLDLDGHGYTIRDNFSGTLRREFRLDLVEGELGHATAYGADSVITLNPNGKAGVELRETNLTLSAESRLEKAVTNVPAVGWSEDVQHLSGTVHLPPGWDILTATGVDDVSGTWLDGWDLWDFFFVLIVAMAAWRSSNVITGFLALFTLVVCHGQSNAPQWIWLAVILTTWLSQFGKKWMRTVSTIIRVATAAMLAVIAVPFAVTQIRAALYPQLTSTGSSYESYGMPGTFGTASQEPVAMDAVPPPAALAPPEGGRGQGAEDEEVGSTRDALLQGLVGSKSREKWKSSKSSDYGSDPAQVVQTGPGVPRWAFRSWTLSWSGPVEKGHTMELYLIPPWAGSLLSVLRVMFIACLAWLLLKARTWNPNTPDHESSSPAVAAALFTLVALSSLLAAPSLAQAQMPDPAILDELKSRLTQAPSCAPACLTFADLAVTTPAGELVLTAEVHAVVATTFTAPGPLTTWSPKTVLLDNTLTAAVRASDAQHLQVRIPAGRHLVVLRGEAPSQGNVTLSFGDIPEHVSLQSTEWVATGIRDDGHVEGSLELSRTITPVGNTENATGGGNAQPSLPAWFSLSRTFVLGVNWTVNSTLQRVSPVGSPEVVRVPLLADESITDASVQLESNAVVVTFRADQTDISWTSTLKPQETLSLKASEGKNFTETWSLDCGPLWHCVPGGIAPTTHIEENRWRPRYNPWPGEGIEVVTKRLAGAPGISTTIDQADLTWSPGIRLLDGKLDLSVRTSTGGIRTIELPKSARILALSVNGIAQPIKFERGKLSIQLQAGSQQVSMSWQEPGGLHSRFDAPTVKLGGDAVNATVVINLPAKRWLLWASGPSWGPAILFWGYLVVILLCAVILSRLPYSPLKLYQWILLALGLTQVPIPVSLIIVGWLFLLKDRERRRLEMPAWHNFRQLVVLGWTFIALCALVFAVHEGLVVDPDMQVQGNNSTNEVLRWYVDRAASMPTPWIVTAPQWVWQGAMLLWALWLAVALIGWLMAGYRAFTKDGIVRSSPAPVRPPRPAAAQPVEVVESHLTAPTAAAAEPPTEKP